MKTIRTAGAASRAVAFALFACFLGASCSDALLDEMGRLAAEANRPAISPSAGSIITAHETITLSFDSDMAAGAVSVGGNIGLAAPAAAWADPRTLNLNLGNVIAWSAGSGKRLTVSISESGQTVVYEYTFEVFNGVCVRTGSNDANPGTTLLPKATVNAGITKAAATYASGSSVHISQGTYKSDYYGTGDSVADMVNGVSLLGGYSPDSWSSRDPMMYETILEDTSTAGGGSVGDANRVIFCSSSVGSGTTVEGCTILLAGVGGTYNAGIFSEGSETVRNCRIIGRATFGFYCISIYSSGGGSYDGNDVIPGGSSSESYGFYLAGSTASVDGNTIIVKGGLDFAIGIYSFSSGTSPTITNNSIDLSTSTSDYKYCIASYNSHPAITDNVFKFDNGDYAVYEMAVSANDRPSQLRRNDFSTNGFVWIHPASGTNITPANYTTVSYTTGEGTALICAPAGWANFSSGL